MLSERIHELMILRLLDVTKAAIAEWALRRHEIDSLDDPDDAVEQQASLLLGFEPIPVASIP